MEEFADLIAQQLQCRVIRKLLKLFLRIAKSHHVPLKSTNFNPDLLILWEGEKKGTGGRLSKREKRGGRIPTYQIIREIIEGVGVEVLPSLERRCNVTFPSSFPPPPFLLPLSSSLAAVLTFPTVHPHPELFKGRHNIWRINSVAIQGMNKKANSISIAKRMGVETNQLEVLPILPLRERLRSDCPCH